MRINVIAAAILAALSTPACAEDCTLKMYTSLDLVGDEHGAPVVSVNIAGKPFRLVVDTSGMYSALSKDVATALALETHETRGIEFYSGSGEVIHQYVNAPDFEIGKIHLEHLSMLVEERSSNDIDGRLAPDFLDRFDVDFDFAAKKLNLFSPDHCEGKVVYWSKTYADTPFKVETSHIKISVTLDGHDFSGEVDTGSDHSRIDEKTSDVVLGVNTSSTGIEHDASAKSDDPFSYHYRFKTLSLSGVEVRNPDLVILPNLAERAYENKHNEKAVGDAIYGEHLQQRDIILGADVLTKLHLYISYKEKKLYFTAADAH